jgi:hypothetical protein
VLAATDLIDAREARYLVDSYYAVQKSRVVAGNQVDALGQEGEPTSLLAFSHANLLAIEEIIKQSLGLFAKKYAVGQWLQSICGIGTVLSAGFLATFDVRRTMILVDKRGGRQWVELSGKKMRQAVRKGKIEVLDQKEVPRATAGAFWKYAGLDPTVVWEKGKIRPWNARAKVLCYKLGESFVKVQNKESDTYGKMIVARKQLEMTRNETGRFADQAQAKLKKYKIGKDTDAYGYYSKGKLPPNHIHSRGRRWGVKLFLSHLHNVMVQDYFGHEAVKPYVFSDNYEECDLHSHYIEPPPFDSSAGDSLRQLYAMQPRHLVEADEESSADPK